MIESKSHALPIGASVESPTSDILIVPGYHTDLIHIDFPLSSVEIQFHTIQLEISFRRLSTGVYAQTSSGTLI
jgi:hypothetical protein